MKVVLDVDDWSIINNKLDTLEKIKEHYPDFKISLFAIPVDYKLLASQLRLHREKFLERIYKNIGWMQFIPHGLTHMQNEFKNCDFYTMRDLVLPSIDEAFKKDGLPYVKGFKAPYWLWNADVTRALDEAGWWGAIDRNQPDMLSTKTFYRYSHSLDEPFFKSTNKIIKLHGHVDGLSANDLDRCLLNIFKLPSDTKFDYVTDHLEVQK